MHHHNFSHWRELSELGACRQADLFPRRVERASVAADRRTYTSSSGAKARARVEGAGKGRYMDDQVWPGKHEVATLWADKRRGLEHVVSELNQSIASGGMMLQVFDSRLGSASGVGGVVVTLDGSGEPQADLFQLWVTVDQSGSVSLRVASTARFAKSANQQIDQVDSPFWHEWVLHLLDANVPSV